MSSPQFKLRYLLNFQRKNISDSGNYGRLGFQDLKRLDTYIKGNIFSSNKCCLYTGEIKKKYSTISYKGKKVSVLRLLICNFVSDVKSEDILEYLCENTGICCNLKHFKIKGNDPQLSFDNMYEDYDKDPFESNKPDCLKNIKNPVFTNKNNNDEMEDDMNEEVFHFED
jgi:hypothetical protein